MKQIYYIGDSHSCYYWHSNIINHHWFGWANLPVTMYKFLQYKIPLYNIVERYSPGEVCKKNIQDNDYVVFSFGWNDIQKNVYKYCKTDYKKFIANMVHKYVIKIKYLSSNAFKINPIISCVYPITQSMGTEINGNENERIQYTIYINQQLKKFSEIYNIPFFDIYNKISENNKYRKEYMNHDMSHLNHNNKALMQYIEEKLIKICESYNTFYLPYDENKVTVFITSCGRPHLLKRTLESFVKCNTYPIEQVVLCEDSGIKGIVDFAKDILPYPILFCYNEERIGQMKTIEKFVTLIKTPYVFHLEDDYEFFDDGFIELSLKILKSDSKISQVLLEDKQHDYYKVDIENPLCYKILTNDPNEANSHLVNNGDGPLSCYSWRPSLKSLDIALLRVPYKSWDDEYTIQLEINKRGLYSVVTKNIKNGRKGFCTHIGKNEHVSSLIRNTNKNILDRIYFGKSNIRMKDI